MMPSKVDLPQPDGPITETISPEWRCRRDVLQHL